MAQMGLFSVRRGSWGAIVSEGKSDIAYRILVGKQKERDHWEGQDVDGWTINRWILDRYDGMIWIALIWLRIVTSEGLL
jgi:hypothetical protein